MRSVLANPWFQLCGLVAVVAGGISVYNEAATGAYSGTPRLPDTTAMQSPAPASTPAAPGDPSTAVYAPQLGVDLAAMTKTTSGLLYRDLTVGTGAMVDSTSQVTVKWTSWLPDGSRWGADSSGRLDGIQLGRGTLIAGFEEGLRGMQAGGKRQVVIPANLGYGATAGSDIPPNSVLVYELELVKAVPDVQSASAVPAAPPDSSSAASAPLAAPAKRGTDGTLTFDTRNTRGKGWGSIRSLAVSGDGHSLATTYTRGRKLVVWETATGLVKSSTALPDDSARVVLTRDGRPFAIIGGVAEVRLYDGLTGRHLRTLPVPETPFLFGGGERRKVELVTQFLAPDDRTLLFTTQYGAILRWDIQSGQSRLMHIHGRELRANDASPLYAIAPDGRHVAASMDSSRDGTTPIQYLDLQAGTKLAEIPLPSTPYGWPSGMAFTPDGRSVYVIKTQSFLYRWDLQANTLQLAATFPRQSMVMPARVSPDGTVFVIPMWPYHPLFMLRLSDGAALLSPGRDDPSNAPPAPEYYEFLPDSRRLAVAYSDGAIRIHPVP